MSSTAAEYMVEMREVVKKLESWKEICPELEKAIKIIKKTVWWDEI